MNPTLVRSDPLDRREAASWLERAAGFFELSGKSEAIFAAILAVFALVARFVDVFRHRFNSDESQHLHAIWGWTHGSLQYRDFFDNHMPLFHLLMAPLAGVLGERAALLWWMRLLMVPLFLAAAWCVYRLGALVFSRRVGVWAAIFLALWSPYFFCSLEFRADIPWALFWLLCLVCLLEGTCHPRRWLGAGLLMSLAFGVSMKSTPLVLALAISGGLALSLTRRRHPQFRPAAAGSAGAFLIAMLSIPALIMLACWLAGIWPQFRYCVFQHNLPVARGDYAWWRPLIFALSLPLLCWVAVRLPRADTAKVEFRRIFFLLLTGTSFAVFWGFWPIVSRQDYLPLYPLAAVCVSALILHLSERFRRPAVFTGWPWKYIPGPAWCALALVVLLLGRPSFWTNGAGREIRLLRDVLALTQPADKVLDTKGETVFRSRCVYPVMETLTRERLQAGLMSCNIGLSCVTTRTCLATIRDRSSMPIWGFVRQHYLPVGDELRVAGAYPRALPGRLNTVEFEVAIPALYEIVAANARIAGDLDGVAYTGARYLSAGSHVFYERSRLGRFCLIWAPAAERHFLPWLRGRRH